MREDIKKIEKDVKSKIGEKTRVSYIRMIFYEKNKEKQIEGIGEFILKGMFLKNGHFAAHIRNFVNKYDGQYSIEWVR